MKYPCLVLKQFCKTEVHIAGRSKRIWGAVRPCGMGRIMQLSRQWKDGAHSRTEAYTA